MVLDKIKIRARFLPMAFGTDTGATATQVQSTADAQSEHSEMLRAEIDKFLSRIRAA